MGWSSTVEDGRPVLIGQDAEASVYALHGMPPMKAREYARDSAATKIEFLLVGGGDSDFATDPGRFWAIYGDIGALDELTVHGFMPEYRIAYAEYTIGPYSKDNPFNIDTIRDCATRAHRWSDKFAKECLDWLTADYCDGSVRWSLRFAAEGDVFTLSHSDDRASSVFTVAMPTDGVPSQQDLAANGGLIRFPCGWSFVIAGRTASFRRRDGLKFDVPFAFACQSFSRFRARAAPVGAASP